MTKTRPPLALAYHAVGDVPLARDWYRLYVRPKELRRHVAKLRKWGYQTVAFAELARAVREGSGEGLAALTFDDGFSDNATVLAPLLNELSATATVFVISGRLGRPHHDMPWARMMTEDELRGLHEAGIEIGAHTVTHPDLTTIGYEHALEELAASKRQLEDIVQADVVSAAYPYGAADDEVIRACRAAGFLAACRTSGNGSWDEPLNLPRQDVGNRQSMLALYLKRDDRYENAMKPLLPILRSKAGRFVVKVLRHYRSVGRS